MRRRHFLKGAVLAGGALAMPGAAVGISFEEYREQQNRSFQNYQARYRAAQQAFRDQVQRYWQDAELSSETRFVQYSKDLSVRFRVDYQQGVMTLEAQAETPAAAGRRIRSALEDLLTLDTRKAYREDAVQQLVDQEALDKRSETLPQDPLIGDLFEGQSVAEVLKPAEKRIVEDRRPVARVVIKLPEGSTARKAARYRPLAEKYAAEQRISPSLVMAVMHTESFFNPVARSHIPAFGLMQIVPESAGLDTSALLYGRSRLLRADELYQPDLNIRNGAAYLHILNERYLAGIKDPMSRMYACIAAYNTGAGNVARAFTGRNRVSLAAENINRMPPDKVYDYLLRNLPYQETRDYLEKVTARLLLYSA